MRLYEFSKKLSNPEKHQYAKQIWQLLNDTYKDIGGMQGSTLENLLSTAGDWEIEFNEEGNIIAGALFRKSHGNKLRLVFQDGTREGKTALKSLMSKTLVHGDYWGELSDPLESAIIKLGGKPVPSKFAEEILGHPIDQYDKDGIHYYREAGGQVRRKALYGHPHYN